MVIVWVSLAGNVARAEPACHKGESFDAWLAGVRKEAASAKISGATLAALDGIASDPKVLKQDRGQPTLSLSFLDFASRVVSADRLARGRALLKKHAATFARIERDFGVRAPLSSPSGGWRPTTAPSPATIPRSVRSRRSPTTAGGRSISGPS
jgi:membrane-bound lytic murein transglycosylase B